MIQFWIPIFHSLLRFSNLLDRAHIVQPVRFNTA
ncbi:hypothetical protein D918_00466 [Trichuris suis]|nr:hypothetical protein D918_00466 [Trichuris suis]